MPIIDMAYIMTQTIKKKYHNRKCMYDKTYIYYDIL
jgi:hypothetical protein